MNVEILKKEIETVIANKPSCYTKGQAVYNHMDFEYGVAKAVKDSDGIDCTADETQIDIFIEHCAKRIKEEAVNE